MRAGLTAFVAAAALCACGGGDDSRAGLSPFPDGQPSGGSGGGGGSPSPPPLAPSGSAQGFWSGTTSTGLYFAALVTEAGDVWGLYGSPGGVAFGAVKGAASLSTGGQLQAVGTDYYIRRGITYRISMSATFTERDRMTGSYTGGNPGTFTAAYDSRYDVAAQLADVAGQWRVFSESTAGQVQTTVSIDSAGNVTASSPLCSLTGTIAPAANGKGYFTISTSFAGVQCPWAGRTLPGVAVRAVIAGADRLTVAAVSADGLTGFVATGTR